MPYRRFPRLKVLVVEDNAVTGLGLEELYRSWGWEATWAASGEAGLIKAKALEPDVIVLDHFLTDMRSQDFSSKLGEAAGDGKQVPLVIVFTAAAGEEVEKIRAAGLRVVRKPADPHELAGVLEGLVAGRGGEGA